jgi:class 3 adenylate cyclase
VTLAAAPSLSRWTLHFRDEALEQRYRESENPKAVRAGRVAAVGGLFLTIVPAILLIAFVPDDWLPNRYVALPGFMVLCAVFLLAWIATFSAAVARHPQTNNAISMCIFSALIASLMRLFPPEFVEHRGFLLIALMIFSAYGLLRFRVVPGAIGGTACIAAYLLVMQAGGMLPRLDLARHFFWLMLCNAWGILVCYQLDLASRREFVAWQEVEYERGRAEGLLLSILPVAIASQLKSSRERIAEHAEHVTVLFADIVGFTPLSAGMRPAELVAMLDRVFTEFDELAQAHGLEKIKTIGDAYMAVAGLPHPQDDHAVRAARMAVAMLDRVRVLAQETGEALQLRVGLNSGPVVAGVIGRSKFSYDLWGDTVNTASRMESTGVANAVHCGPATAALLQGFFPLHARGAIEIKGKGMMETYLL